MTRYRTIVADPPWDYPEGFVGGSGRTVSQGTETYRGPSRVDALPYKSMTLEAIAALDVQRLADDHCRLFLWTTNRFLPESFEVVKAWGFRYRQTLVWHKTDTNLPASIAPNSAEFLLVGAKGTPERTGSLPSAVFPIARRGGPGSPSHSQKPEAFLDLVESVSPGPYLEMFARRNRLGWDTWGNESLEHVEMGA